MIPAPVLAAVAPAIIDKFADKILGGATASPAINTSTGTLHPHEQLNTTAGPAIAPGLAPLVDMVGEYFNHEKKKASVRPAAMQASWQFTVVAAACYVAAAFAPGLGLMTLEHSTHAMDALLWVIGGGAGFYGYKHTVRSVEKMGGKA